MGAQPSRSVEAKPIQTMPGGGGGFLGRMKRPPMPVTGTIRTGEAISPTGSVRLTDVKPLSSTNKGRPM
jgi:hypothetical protein